MQGNNDPPEHHDSASVNYLIIPRHQLRILIVVRFAGLPRLEFGQTLLYNHRIYLDTKSSNKETNTGIS